VPLWVHKVLEILGGVAVITTALAVFFGNLIRDYFKQHLKNRGDAATEHLKERGKIDSIQPQHFAGDQYDVYVKLWKQLGALQIAVNQLWESVTEENILSLAAQLHGIRAATQDWSLFFEDYHLDQLHNALRTLDDFQAGKTELRDLRSREQLNEFPTAVYESTIRECVNRNGTYKLEFESLLEQIRTSFRAKLSGHVEERAGELVSKRPS